MMPARKLESYPAPVPVQRKRSKPKQKPSVQQHKMPEVAVVGLFAALVVLASLLYLGQQVHIMRLCVSVREMEQIFAQVSQDKQHLLVALDTERSLRSVESRARGDLGMVEPRRAAVVVLGVEHDEVSAEGGWVREEPVGSFLTAVADWINRWLPLGGVEAGRIGYSQEVHP